MCKQIKDLHSLVYVTLLFMYLCITYVTHKDAILDVKVQVPCNGLLRSNFSEKEEATWIKIGEDYNFIQLGDWVYLALLYDLWSTIHRKQIDFYLIYLWPFWLQQRKRKKLKCYWKIIFNGILLIPANTRFFSFLFLLARYGVISLCILSDVNRVMVKQRDSWILQEKWKTQLLWTWGLWVCPFSPTGALRNAACSLFH